MLFDMKMLGCWRLELKWGHWDDLQKAIPLIHSFRVIDWRAIVDVCPAPGDGEWITSEANVDALWVVGRAPRYK